MMKRSWVSMGIVAGLAMAATAEQAIFFAPHSGMELRDTSAKTLPVGPPTEVFTTGDMTFNLYYIDVIDGNNIGFDGPNAVEARQRVRDCLAYLESALNEDGTLDVLFNESETDGDGFLAAAGTLFPVGDGFFGGSTLARLHDPNDDKPFAGSEEIGVTVDFGFNWNFGAGNPTVSQVDFQSVLLHEFTHGLGFSSLSRSDGASRFTEFAPPNNTDTYTVYDTFLRRRSGNVTLFSGGGTPVFNGTAADLISNDLAWGGAEASQAYLPQPAPGNYAPATFAQGSSLSHWDTGNIVGGAVMEHAIFSGVVRREYSAVDLGGLRDIGYLDAAEPDVEANCDLQNGCPDFFPQGSALIAFLVGNSLLPPFVNYFNADLDNLPSTVMLDTYELALLNEVLCNNTAFSEDALCAFAANLDALEDEAIYPLLAASEDYVAALLTISSELQAAAASLGLTGSYTVAGSAKALGEPLSPDGDPDGDGLTNQEEYDNVIADGGDEADYVAAALNPLLDGTSASAAALPLAGVLGAGALLGTLAGLGIAALRRKRRD